MLHSTREGFQLNLFRYFPGGLWVIYLRFDSFTYFPRRGGEIHKDSYLDHKHTSVQIKELVIGQK